MLDEQRFQYDIENIKCDLAIEGMYLTEEDVLLFRRYMDDEIGMPELIELIKRKPLFES